MCVCIYGVYACVRVQSMICWSVTRRVYTRDWLGIRVAIKYRCPDRSDPERDDARAAEFPHHGFRAPRLYSVTTELDTRCRKREWKPSRKSLGISQTAVDRLQVGRLNFQSADRIWRSLCLLRHSGSRKCVHTRVNVRTSCAYFGELSACSFGLIFENQDSPALNS